jgi:uncharacterized protein YcfL
MKKVTFVALSIFTAVLTSCGGGETTTPATGDSTTVVTDTTKVSDSTVVKADTVTVTADTAKAGK